MSRPNGGPDYPQGPTPNQGYPPPNQPPPAPRKRRRWPWIVGGAILLIIIIAAVNSGGGAKQGFQDGFQQGLNGTSAAAAPTAGGAPAPAATAPAPTGGDVIRYEVTGADGVKKANNITYIKDKNFGQQQANNKPLPWSAEVKFDSGFLTIQPLTLVAQSGSSGDGSITCRILKNGQELTSSTSSGPYAVVTCSSQG